MIVDVLSLSGLYAIRLVAGGAAVAITLSFWLIAFSAFIFLSLALLKRYSELLKLSQWSAEDLSIPGRGYRLSDLEGLAQFGVVSGYLSVMVLAFYVGSEEVTELYASPQFMWLICPLFLYWVSRVWLLARRNQLQEDPVIFALTDRASHVVALISLAIMWAAI